jgi:hypothetical protein
MNRPLYKKGDRVHFRGCEELIQPLEVVGLDAWNNSIKKNDGSMLYVYEVIGKHAKRNNLVSVKAEEPLLSKT